MHSNFSVVITISNKAVDVLSREGIIKLNINDYKDAQENYIFEKIQWECDNFCESGDSKATILFNDGRSEEINNCEDVFDDDWGAFYLSMDKDSFYSYIENTANCDEKKLREIEDIIISEDEVKNWIRGITAIIKNSRMERD